MDGLTNLLSAAGPAVGRRHLYLQRRSRRRADDSLKSQADFCASDWARNAWYLPQLPVIPLGIQDARTSSIRRHSEQGHDDHWALTTTPLSCFSREGCRFMPRRIPWRCTRRWNGPPQTLAARTERASGGVRTACQSGHCASLFGCRHARGLPDVRVLSLDGREGDNYPNAWAGADVFCSLSDNLQETFGLTPMEAMAAGLPVVVSDWDGYKDTVRDGVDGFRIPTLDARRRAWARPGAAPRASPSTPTTCTAATPVRWWRWIFEAAAQAFDRLFASPALRRQMGDTGRQRAREVLRLGALIPRYEALWAQLAAMRRNRRPRRCRQRTLGQPAWTLSTPSPATPPTVDSRDPTGPGRSGSRRPRHAVSRSGNLTW